MGESLIECLEGNWAANPMPKIVAIEFTSPDGEVRRFRLSEIQRMGLSSEQHDVLRGKWDKPSSSE